MSAKALIEVDMRIAVLREQTAQGEGSAEKAAQMEKLLKERGELVRKLVAERWGKEMPRPKIRVADRTRMRCW